MMWDLPVSVEIDGKTHAIRNRCDYRVVLDVISALNDEDLTQEQRIQCSLIIFYEKILDIENIEAAMKEMFKVINLGEEQNEEERKPKLMDWEHDFPQIAPPVSRVLGYSVRDPKNYTHWYDFIGAYQEIGGECTFSTIISIRSKRAKGKKLDKWEEEYLREHRKMVELPRKLTAEEQEYLDSEW